MKRILIIVAALLVCSLPPVLGQRGNNNKPSVSITAPANNATFNAPANVTVSANATDSDGTITKVDFYAGSKLIGTDAIPDSGTSRYSVQWNNVAAGSYALTARATDNAQGKTTSSAVNITVNGQTNSPPAVSITSPANNAAFTAPATITIQATASDTDGTVAKVEFFQGVTKLGEDTTTPYSYVWSGVAAGGYSLTAKATDNAGATTTSSAVNITVNAVSSNNNPPVTPTITEPGTDGQIVHPADVHMEASPFSDQNLGDTHVCTDWEIWTTITPSERVWVTSCIPGVERTHTHLGDGVFENSHAGRTELMYNTDYRLRARYKDSSGDPATQWSAWAERPFRTASQPATGGPITWSVMQPGYQVEIFATGFELPVNITFVPNPGPKPSDAYLYVTELYGTIKVVTRDGTVSDYLRGALNYRPSGIFPGSGEQGLTGIVVDPVSGDVFASMLYDPDGIEGGPKYPKVVRYQSHTNGKVANKATTILDMVGETQGQSHQISNLSIGPDGKLYVHNGDGFDDAVAQDLDSFRGKILRMNLDGSAPSDNPFYNASDGINAKDYVYAYGFRNPFGGIWRASDNFHYSVENGPSVDRFAKIVRGRNYLWDGSDASMRNYAIYNWSPAAAPVNVAFIQPETFNGSGFPTTKMGNAFVTESGPTWATGPQGVYGKRVSEFALDANGNLVDGPTTLIEYTGTGKATAAGLATGPDGLYFTDLYVDRNFDTAVARGANILRIKYVGTNNTPPAPVGSGTGLKGEYYDNQDFTLLKVTRTDATVNFDWGAGSPGATLGPDTFSVRWTGQVQPRYSDTYTFYTVSDDGVRLWVNGQLVIDNWTDHAPTENPGSITLAAGQKYDIRIEYYENGGGAVAKLLWSSVSQAKEVIPQSQLYTPPGP